MTKITFQSSTIDQGNMSMLRGDRKEVLENRESFFQKHKVDYSQHVGISPTHTTNIRTATLFDKQKSFDDVDAIITSDTTLSLFTLTADCIPLALVDPEKKVFSLVHVSWLNANQGMITEIISAFIYNFHSAPKNLVAKIGPSIGPCCYHQKKPSQMKDKKWQPFIKPIDGSYAIDLWGFVEQGLETLGVQRSNIENPKICTYHSGQYFSHHKVVKEKLEKDYRLGTILTIK